MIGITAAVVADCGTNVCRHSIKVAEDIFDALTIQVSALNGRVQFAGIAGVVFAVMNAHGAGINMRLQRVFCIRKR